jgi:hypothetical protein
MSRVEFLCHLPHHQDGNVTGRDDAYDALAIDDREMAEAAFIHATDGHLHRLLGADGLKIGGHDVAQLGPRRFQTPSNDADEKVALGEDAEQAFVLHNEDAIAAILGHALGAIAGVLIGVSADKHGAEASAVKERAHGTPRHVELSLM